MRGIYEYTYTLYTLCRSRTLLFNLNNAPSHSYTTHTLSFVTLFSLTFPILTLYVCSRPLLTTQFPICPCTTDCLFLFGSLLSHVLCVNNQQAQAMDWCTGDCNVRATQPSLVLLLIIISNHAHGRYKALVILSFY